MQRELLEKPIGTLYRSYVVPTLVAMLSNSLYCLVDVYFISFGSGSLGLAALNIAMPLFTLYSCIGLVFGVGASTIMAIAFGAKDETMRSRAFTMCMWMLLGIGIVVTILGSIFLEPFAYALGCSEDLLPYVLQYMRPIQFSALCFIMMYATPILLRCDHNPRLAMIAMLVGNLSNIVLDYIFVVPFQMGIFGAAFATALSPCITLVIASFHFILKKHSVHFVHSWYEKDMLKRMISNGLGSGVMEISAGFVILIFNGVILSIGNEITLAAFAIITNIAYVCKGLLNGFAQAAQPIISSNYGAGNMGRVKEALCVSLRYASVFAMVVYAGFLFFPKQVCIPFANGDQVLIEVASHGVPIYFSCLLFLACNMMLMYYFQSIEKGKLSSLLAVCKGIVFVIFGLFLLTPLFHMDGVWFVVTLAEGICLWIATTIYRKAKNA